MFSFALLLKKAKENILQSDKIYHTDHKIKKHQLLKSCGDYRNLEYRAYECSPLKHSLSMSVSKPS